jgi:hypothetical protein
MKKICGSLLIFAALALSRAIATTVIPPTFNELVDQAQLIFQGTVTDVRCEWAGEGAQRRIESVVTFQIEDAIKGAPGAAYTLRMLGGTIGEETMGIAEAPTFKIGDRDILFVENNGTQFIPLVGIMYGRYRVQSDIVAGKEIVANEAGGPVAGVTGVGATEFKTAIRTRLATSAH